MTDLNILVVEDEVIIASSLQEMLSDLGYKESLRCSTFVDAKRFIASEKHGLVILDINLEGNFEGLDLAKICDQKSIPYFFLTSYSDQDTFRKAKSYKPGSYVIKPFSREEIMVAVELSLMDSKTEQKGQIQEAAKFFKLSNRESQIVQFVFDGYTNSDISEALSLSTNTIKYHLRNIFSKMGVSSKSQVIERIRKPQ